MTLDDESLLTAYLDGELDPDQRLPIEAALASDPELAEQLRRLAAVRALVAGLPRPVPAVDLAETIADRIASSPTRPAPALAPLVMLLPRRHLRLFAALGGLGLAATVLIALGLSLRANRPAPVPERFPQVAAVVAAPEAPTNKPAPQPHVAPSSAVASDLEAAPAGRSRAHGEAAATDDSPEAEQIREMLDSPHLRRIFIVTDVMGGGDRDRVEELVQKTPRTEATYGRITITQGIVIDPRRPNAAVVFALVMNDQELRNFQKQLAQTFPQQVEEAGVDSAVVTQLADIGQVAVLAGTSAAEVVIPAEGTPRVALRTDESRNGTFLGESRLSSEFGLRGRDGIGDPGIPPESDASEKMGDEKAPSRTRAPNGKSSPALARRDDEVASARTDEGAGTRIDAAAGPPQAGKVADRAVSASPLKEALARASSLEVPPSIVLVWVTSPLPE